MLVVLPITPTQYYEKITDSTKTLILKVWEETLIN